MGFFLFNQSVNDSSYGYICPQRRSLTMQVLNHSTSVSGPRKPYQIAMAVISKFI